MCCYFPQTAARQHSTPPPLGRGEIFPPFIRPPNLSTRTGLDHVVPFKSDEVARSPGGIGTLPGVVWGQPW
jgi:hypothetical protein